MTSACCMKVSAVDIPNVQLVHDVGMNPKTAHFDDPVAISTEAGMSIAMSLPIVTICRGRGWQGGFGAWLGGGQALKTAEGSRVA